MSNAPAVYGARETLAALKNLDPTLKKEVMKEIRAASKPMAQAVAGHIPTTAPIRGMDNDGRLGWGKAKRTVRIKVGGRRGRKDIWPLVSLVLDSAPTALFDMAGRKSSSPLSSALDAAYGEASRAGWRADATLERETHKAILDAINKACSILNKELVTKGKI